MGNCYNVSAVGPPRFVAPSVPHANDPVDLWTTLFEDTYHAGECGSSVHCTNKVYAQFPSSQCPQTATCFSSNPCDFIVGMEAKGDKDILIMAGDCVVAQIKSQDVKTKGTMTDEKTYYCKLDIPINLLPLKHTVWFMGVTRIKWGVCVNNTLRNRCMSWNSHTWIPSTDREYKIVDGCIWVNHKIINCK